MLSYESNETHQSFRALRETRTTPPDISCFLKGKRDTGDTRGQRGHGGQKGTQGTHGTQGDTVDAENTGDTEDTRDTRDKRHTGELRTFSTFRDCYMIGLNVVRFRNYLVCSRVFHTKIGDPARICRLA